MPQMEAIPSQDKDGPFARAAAMMLAGANVEAATLWPTREPYRGELIAKPLEPAQELPTAR
jgi:hypothetical protein